MAKYDTTIARNSDADRETNLKWAKDNCDIHMAIPSVPGRTFSIRPVSIVDEATRLFIRYGRDLARAQEAVEVISESMDSLRAKFEVDFEARAKRLMKRAQDAREARMKRRDRMMDEE